MPTVSRDDLKKKGINRLFKSFKYAYEGLKYAFKYEQNILVHFLATILVIIVGIFFKISMTEWLVLTLIIGLVIATELINTALLSIIVKELYNPTLESIDDNILANVFNCAMIKNLQGDTTSLQYILVKALQSYLNSK